MIQEDFLYSLSRSIQLLPFESRKDTQSIFSYVFRFKPPNATNLDPPALVYVTHSRPETVINLCRGYEHKESAMPCGVVLREALKNEAIAAIILYDDSPIKTAIADSQGVGGVFWNFFTWIDGGAFEVSTDAFTTFRVNSVLLLEPCAALTHLQEILTKHKKLIAQFMTDHFEVFFAHYNNVLVQSSSYVTKRQSIKLLGELLLDRANYNVMTAYVDKGDHLKLCMNLLRDDRKMVQYEGFHVFKVCTHDPSLASSPLMHPGLCRQPQQVACRSQHPHQKPRSSSELSPSIPGGSDG